ncbi:hypothetical protein CANCADRAFT_70907 [Tortispora caseinolytica NRRL Y-17796]|uniref:Septin-type G domain-containing protein n=1 Tax=Tortispora caseinolytica NRRL Y-17796 TaxID=767744 RepID=A0A1E4TI81_9ASCO|nr:hypothetical protein CANCADRAFT_70907 [Tortispora caseinolytica NRRL Y-17796]
MAVESATVVVEESVTTTESPAIVSPASDAEEPTVTVGEAEPVSPSQATSPAASSFPSHVIKRQITGYVGFANLPNQWHRRTAREGFTFNVMVVGTPGVGKSTLINTLFKQEVCPLEDDRDMAFDPNPAIEMRSVSADIEENGVKLSLTVVDAVNYGESLNNRESWRPILNFIEHQFDNRLDADAKANRGRILDTNIHACLFFIEPTGHSLKAIEIETMRQIHHRVNLIPVIAKSDLFSPEELQVFKDRIRADIEYHGIKVFEPTLYSNDENAAQSLKRLLSVYPLAVIGSTTEVARPDGTKVLGRSYPWGVVEIENPSHCDFLSLRDLLIGQHMESLREKTNRELYEFYRTEKLTALGHKQDETVFREINPAQRLEEERNQHKAKLAKMEQDMRVVFQTKVREKEEKLRMSEQELFKRHQAMRDELNVQRKELEERKARLESGRLTASPAEEKKGRRGFNFAR